MPHSQQTSTTPKGSFIKAAMWTSSCRWLMKFIGIFSTMILVRVLMPHDFGLVVKALLIIGPIEAIAETKFSSALVRTKKPTDDDYSTTFTLNLILGCICFVIVNIFAFFADDIMNEKGLNVLVHLLSLRFLFLGIENPKVTDYLRDFNYSKDFSYLLTHRVLSIFVNVSACLYFRNYWGLIVGHMSHIGILSLLSYVFIPYRPRFTLINHKKFLDFSIPDMRGNLSNFLLINIDRFLTARLVSESMLGIYNIAYELAFQLTTEVVYPLSRAFFPVFSEIDQNKNLLQESYFRVLQFMLSLCLGIAMGLFVIAEPLIHAYAGNKWLGAIRYFEIFAFAGSAHVFCMVNGSVLSAVGHVRLKERLFLLQMILTTICMLPFMVNINLYHIVLVKAGISILFMCIHIIISTRIFNVPLNSFILYIIRLLASISAIYYLHELSHIYDIYINLLLQIFCYGLIFMIVHFSLWYLFARHQENTIEEKVIETIASIFNKFKTNTNKRKI